ncbi:hypothetical protein POM88_015973 [Heracleum sosnowskyi]|uniref:Cyclic nucleotide-binding domain-containing protein n=1 Tax=Heracleum sosnowskyi TaxID=360622 RepID=A0AAD8MSI8_9APIA|nr:hypothetical protein POM88_015973 [Heracleum sosnowskyi]
MVFKFRVAYVDPESRVFVYDPKRVALNYLFGYFIIDFFLVLPFAQNILRLILELYEWPSGLVGFSSLFEVVSILQYLAMLCRILSMLAEHSTSIFVCESWLSKFLINLLAFFLFSHVVGSFWYYFATISVAQCLTDACGAPKLCKKSVTTVQQQCYNSTTSCFGPDGFDYGIFGPAVPLMKESNLLKRYIYSLFWGSFAILSSHWKYAELSPKRRSLEMSVRSLDVEQWMRYRRLPQELKRQIRESERYHWLTTRGVNELMLLENLPEDLQRDIRRHLFGFVERFPIFSLMEESILDAIRERLKQKIYIRGSRILIRGGLTDKMVSIVQGKLQSIGEDKNVVPLSKGDVCGEELITSFAFTSNVWSSYNKCCGLNMVCTLRLAKTETNLVTKSEETVFPKSKFEK